MTERLPILVVDDQWPMREAVTSALHDMGFPATLQAVNGVDAMRILKSVQVSAVISDWNMPGLSGLGLLRWVRNEARHAAVPFMLVTAESDRERVRSAIQAGASEYLVKPFTVQDLANKVRKMLGREGQELPSLPAAGQKVLGLPNAAEAESRIGSLTVMVVDDMPENLALIGEILKGAYVTMAALSGQEALALARAVPPDLILLDVVMPGMDGYEVCRQLKADPITRDIPIIFLTSIDGVADVVRGLEVGAVDYIVKPAEPSILKARIRTQLRLRLAFADLASQNASLEASARLREDVERITQHDLKNPIHAIITGTDMLLAGEDDAKSSKEMLQLVQAEAWRALDLVNQSLSLYRMETGTFVLQPTAVDLAAILATVRHETLTAFAGMFLDIRISASDGGEMTPGRFMVWGEEGLCHSLFGNLLRNAAEASSEKSVVEVRFSSGQGSVTVSVGNEKPVPMAVRACFFDKYVTAGKSHGTGLGTYSAKLVTEAQHGTIEMRTDDVTGTVVTVCLPRV
ncbi:MAG TPA: response regulator [Noviherbaspirillum sp.]|nr:response regulator [Noviherbaspirillum sp.]